MADTNNLHTADSLTAVMAAMEAMELRSFLTHPVPLLLGSSTDRLVTTELVEPSITEPTLLTSAFPRAVQASNPSTRVTKTLLPMALVDPMVPDLATVAMAATEDNLPVLSVVSLATALVVATVAMVATVANAISTATMSARRLATVVSLVTVMAPTKM